MKFLIVCSLILSSHAFAQEGANTAAPATAIEAVWMKDMEAGLDVKQQKSMALLAMVAGKMNNATDDNRREEAEYAHVGFTARFQSYREDRAELASKGQKLDYASIQVYSRRLDVLIADLQSFLK